MKRLTILMIAAFLLVACAGTPPLAPRSGGNPEQVDLSGQWMLRGQTGLPRNDEQTIRIPPRLERSSNQRRRSDSRRDGASLHVFLTSGRELKITQTVYALFFSFDRAIVREYNFGENRTENVGPIEARRVSGWDGKVFMIDTQGEDGDILTEAWSLKENGAVLVRDISVRRGEETSFATRQVFDRR
jgi:hypothetical protein